MSNKLTAAAYEEFLTVMDGAADGVEGFQGVASVTAEGEILPALTPETFLYVACGESTLLYLDAFMHVVPVQVEG